MTSGGDADPNPRAAGAAATARALDRLRAAGQRMTVARRAVIEALAGHDGHPDVEEICAAVEASVPGVHRATVYRTLETLTELGVVRHVHVGHGTTTYHLAAARDGTDHLHAQCHACGAVIDLPGRLLDAVRDEVTDRYGFTLEPRHVALSGTCATCPATD